MDRKSHIPLLSNTKIPSTAKPSQRAISNLAGFNSVGRMTGGGGGGNFGYPNSTHKNHQNGFQIQSKIPSTVKSVNRPISRISSTGGGGGGPIGFGCNSVKKNPMNLFGMTPRTNRSSYVLNKGIASTTRISRVSSIGGGGGGQHNADNRMLTDPNYQRECQEKIVAFLTMNNYPQQISRQNLIRLSLTDASRIFQFLFSFFFEDVCIKNGPDTSLEVVVTKLMPMLNYPYPIKRSDLLSLSGGRQLGATLSMMVHIIDYINYSLNLDVSRIFSRNFVAFPDDIDDNGNANSSGISINNNNNDCIKAFPRLFECACSLDWDNITEDNKQKMFQTLTDEFYGNEQDVEQLRKDVDKNEQQLIKIDEELQYYTNLPKQRKTLMEDLENCSCYIIEMIEHNKANMKIKLALEEEIELEKESVKKLIQENKRLQLIVDEQKEIRIQYQHSIERQKHFKEELEQTEEHIKELQEKITISMIELEKEKSKLESLINDYGELLQMIINSNNIMITLEGNEWNELFQKFDQIKSMKNLDQDNNNENEQNIEKILIEFQTLSLKKFKELKMYLVEQISKLKTTSLLEAVCKHQDKQRQHELMLNELDNIKQKLESLWNEKNNIEMEHCKQLKQLDEQVEQYKQIIMNKEKLLQTKNDSINLLNEQYKNLEQNIEHKKLLIMEQYHKQQLTFKLYETKLIENIDKYLTNLKNIKKCLKKK